MEFLESFDEVRARHVAHAGVKDDAVHVGKEMEDFDGFGAAVSGEDVDFCGLDDELAGGDGAGVFAIGDEIAGPDHAFDYDGQKLGVERTQRGVARGSARSVCMVGAEASRARV